MSGTETGTSKTGEKTLERVEVRIPIHAWHDQLSICTVADWPESFIALCKQEHVAEELGKHGVVLAVRRTAARGGIPILEFKLRDGNRMPVRIYRVFFEQGARRGSGSTIPGVNAGRKSAQFAIGTLMTNFPRFSSLVFEFGAVSEHSRKREVSRDSTAVSV